LGMCRSCNRQQERRQEESGQTAQQTATAASMNLPL
jgi:hypothetical protein